MAQGYTYLDVRSEAEFAAGHPPGAFNIPLMHAELDRLVDNPEFLTVVKGVFPRETPLLVGCRSGVRSLTAVQLLAAEGYEQLAELGEGFHGARDAFGRLVPGWLQHGFDVEQGTPEARSYAALRARALGAAGERG